MGIQVTVTIADDQLDALASKIADAVLNAAPGLTDAGNDTPAPLAPIEAVEPQDSGSSSASSPAPEPAPAQLDANDPATARPTGSVPEGQTPGFAGAVIDPITHRMVEPGETTVASNEPADPAPTPPQS